MSSHAPETIGNRTDRRFATGDSRLGCRREHLGRRGRSRCVNHRIVSAYARPQAAGVAAKCLLARLLSGAGAAFD